MKAKVRVWVERLRETVRPHYLRHIYFPMFPERKPAYFDACWEFPEYDGGPVAPLPLVVFLPMNDWHTRMQRSQHLALALSRLGYRCLYVNPHLGREFASRRTERSVVTVLAENLYELHVHLPREPVFHHRRLTGEESDRVVGAVSKAAESLRASSVALLAAFPVWFDAALALRELLGAPLLYDCHDYLPGFAGIAQEILDQEPDLFRASDLILCSAHALRERARNFAGASFGGVSKVMLLRNAAASELLRIERAKPDGVIIGYIGALDTWFDTESVRSAALAHPEWRFQLVGRIEDEQVRELDALPNIEFAGEVPFARLPAYLASFTAAVIPFRVNRLIEATDPIKVYEYFAAGLPVVASAIPELARFGMLIPRYRDAAEFVQYLEAAIAGDSAEKVAQRRTLAAAETWERRAEDLSREIERLQAGVPEP